ncbi:hypothetical protein BDQ94DRAFT_146009 [Aspergillus welwitschiae]|uniref:Uncharacterized protein n=1 Tax=Aspergillus welwitschiae TaxID=1341132 RepID=A0A3F3PYI3_9EURO|nr:hypothetical protein BDQ94DRAFT_146009 [Aspergillus welwitschiae]RDH31907.1 hypothetical protein BDQ94DRAFT_146009 [Aspergillus welwitschiae]
MAPEIIFSAATSSPLIILILILFLRFPRGWTGVGWGSSKLLVTATVINSSTTIEISHHSSLTLSCFVDV